MFLFQQTESDDVGTTPSQTEVTEAVELQNTPLSPREMFRLSRRIAVDWEMLAALMGITSAERDDIRCNIGVYYDNCARAEKILSIFNCQESFSRKELADLLKEIEMEELVEPILTGKLRSL